jgi:hypothetical protein
VAQPVPVERLVPDFKALPPLRKEASDEEIDRWHESFFETAREAEARMPQAQEPEQEKPATEAKPKKSRAKKDADGKKQAPKKKAPEAPPEADSGERWAAAYERAEREIDVSAAFRPRKAGDSASA